MIPVQIYIQNRDDDTEAQSIHVQTFLPAMPQKGDTVYLSRELSVEFSRQSIFRSELDAARRRAGNWKNLIHSTHGKEKTHFMSLQNFFNVTYSWFDTRNSSANIILSDVPEGEISGIFFDTVNDELLSELQKNLYIGKIYF